MNPPPTAVEKRVWLRAIVALFYLGLLGLLAWQSMPEARRIFDPAEVAVNRRFMTTGRFSLAPIAVVGGVTTEPTGVRLPPGSRLEFDLASTRGLFRARFQAIDPKRGAVVEITAAGGDGKVHTLLQRRLSVAERRSDDAPFWFATDPAAPPGDVRRLVLSVPAASPGAVDWADAGVVPPERAGFLRAMPMPVLMYEGFVEPVADGPIVYTHAPMHLILAVPPGRREFSATFGYNPDLFTKPDADTDGIGFRVILETDAGSRTLLHRDLDPRTRPEDRQLQSARLDLECDAPARLHLITDPGPQGVLSWDWTVWRDLRLEPPAGN